MILWPKFLTLLKAEEASIKKNEGIKEKDNRMRFEHVCRKKKKTGETKC